MRISDWSSDVCSSDLFGFRWFALVHNVDLKRTTRKALLITTYPARWVEEVIDARLHLDDPVHVACAKTVSGLTWDQIGDYIAPNARQLSILERGRGHGLASGFTMPIRMRDEDRKSTRLNSSH